ncbi:hypothetical protein DPMN_143382 [Dreissena polymorpha]|uniref:Uncharacterized protein n=1 Tax=Dreissena polymorpha TaxID=45954 RepID=A0A9D4GDK3_DREPO|nr:hypothetical protein DPMN_143382 [Dreissena polymorpha]
MLDPHGFLDILEKFASFTINLEVALFIFLMLLRSRNTENRELNIPVPMPDCVYYLVFLIPAYFGFAVGYDVKVTKILRQEDLCTKDSLKLVNERELMSNGVPLGSAKLICKEVLKWTDKQETSAPPATATVEPVPNEVTLDLAGKSLDDLLGQFSEPHVNTTYQQTNVHFMDPRSDQTMKAKSKKAVHIDQFLTEKSKRKRQNRRKEYVLRSKESETLVIKTYHEHPYLGIQIKGWGAANMGLLNHLLSTNLLQRQEVEYYLAYTTRIFEFADIYEWSSVLGYDYHYRELQAEHNFKWGTFSPHMGLQTNVSS